MHLKGYQSTTDSKHETYEFLSSGPKGTIKKVVVYQKIGNNIYNLAFGDWDEISQRIKDDVKTNNADRDQVIITVAHTVLDFMEYHPDAILFAKGESPVKTRLYQMGISTNWKIISLSYNIEGFSNGIWESFTLKKNYEAFLLKAK